MVCSDPPYLIHPTISIYAYVCRASNGLLFFIGPILSQLYTTRTQTCTYEHGWLQLAFPMIRCSSMEEGGGIGGGKAKEEDKVRE